MAKISLPPLPTILRKNTAQVTGKGIWHITDSFISLLLTLRFCTNSCKILLGHISVDFYQSQTRWLANGILNLTQLPVKLEEAVSSVLKDITPEMKNSFCNILEELFSLTLEMPGRLNYTQLARMGTHTEKTYREAFSREVDWAGIDGDTIFREFSRDDSLSIVIDPSFLQKSGRCTPGAGLYWSGVAGAVRHGLEII